MTNKEIIKALRSTPSRSKRALLDEAADRLEQLQKEKEALVADLKKLEETGEISTLCILCSHCYAGGKPIYQPSDDYLEYCTSCDEAYSNFKWRGEPDEKTDSGLLEE